MATAAVTKKTKPKKRIPNRREQIVRAAARLFRENGYEATTVRDLAEAVSMQSGSLFFHFGSKEEILLAVLKGGLERAEVALERQLANASTPQQKLAACFRAHLRTILEEERDAFTVVLRDWRMLSAEARQEVIRLRDHYEARLDDVLKELQDRGLIAGDRHLLRLYLLGALNWTIQWYRPDGRLTVDQLAERFLLIFRRHAER